MAELSCYDCIHCEVCSGIGACSYLCSDVSKCKYFRNKADVAPVEHGEWKWGYSCGQYGIWCTNCEAGWVDGGSAELIAYSHDYCPKCGAKMDGVTDTNVGDKNEEEGKVINKAKAEAVREFAERLKERLRKMYRLVIYDGDIDDLLEEMEKEREK